MLKPTKNAVGPSRSYPDEGRMGEFYSLSVVEILCKHGHGGRICGEGGEEEKTE